MCYNVAARLCTAQHVPPVLHPICLPSGPSLSIEGAHATAINCLRWSPSSAHVLLSASHDPAILLHDIRQPGQPLHRLVGHSPAARCVRGWVQGSRDVVGGVCPAWVRKSGLLDAQAA